MDKSHPEPIEDNDKHETIKDAENSTEHSTVSDKSEAEQSQQPKPYFATGANQANTSKDKHDDVTVKQDKDESKDHHNGKKVQQSVLEQQVWLEAQQVKVLLPLQNHMPLIMQVKTMMNMTTMTEIKNVKKVAWPKYCYH